MTFDEKLAQALSNTAKARAEQMLAAPKEHKFSLAYRLWEYRTLKNLSRNRYDKRWTLRRAKRIIAAAMIAAASLLLTAYVAVTFTERFSFHRRPEYSQMFIENSDSDKASLEEYYGLPEEDGWRNVGYCANDVVVGINYERGETRVSSWQEIIHEGSMGNINTKKADPEPVSLYEKNDGFILSFRDGFCMIFWVYDGYLLELNGYITKDEAINLAYSTKIVNLE